MIILRPDNTQVQGRSKFWLEVYRSGKLPPIPNIYIIPGWYTVWYKAFGQLQFYIIDNKLIALENKLFNEYGNKSFCCLLNKKHYLSKEEIEKITKLSSFI